MMEKLEELLRGGFGKAERYNCAEKILAGANAAYEMGLPPEALRLVGPMGNGLTVGSLCGALNAAAMVLGYLYADDSGHGSSASRAKVKALLTEYRTREGSLDCKDLRATRAKDGRSCDDLIYDVGGMLDAAVAADPL